MRIKQTKSILCLLIFTGSLFVSCGKKVDSIDPEPWAPLIGRWTGEVKSEVNGDKIVETTSVNFYERGTYRWEFTYTVNKIKNEDESFDEDGSFTATEDTITFVPYDGDSWTVTYELTGRSDILLILRDSEGNVWNFTEVWYPSQSK